MDTETIATVRAHHHHRWDIAAYRAGWEASDRAITADYSSIDAPTARTIARDCIARANAAAANTNQFYRDLGHAARWLAALT